MRFFGMSYEDVLKMPIKTFWFLSSTIERIRAEETIAIMPAHATAMGGEGVADIVEELRQKIGSPSIFIQKQAKANDLAALDRLFGPGS